MHAHASRMEVQKNAMMAAEGEEGAPFGSGQQWLQSLPCCPCSKYNAKCVRSCQCKQRGALCSSCGPLSLDRCRNHGTPSDGASSSSRTDHDCSPSVVDGSCLHPDEFANSTQSTDAAADGPHFGANDAFLQEKFAQAFGTPLLNHDGGPDSETRSLWWKVAALQGKQYSLPDGGVGTRFVNMLSEEIERCTEGRQPSEREFIFTALILQRNKMVRKDVR